SPAMPAASAPAERPATQPPAKPVDVAAPVPQSTPAAAPAPAPVATKPKPAPVTKAAAATAPAAGSLVVQVAAFSTRQRADAVAARLGASVNEAGRFWRVRLGPFPSRAAAQAALAKAKGAGYSDARIQRAD